MGRRNTIVRTRVAVVIGLWAAAALSAGEALAQPQFKIERDPPRPGMVWLRQFPGPRTNIPVETTIIGDNFEARRDGVLVRELSDIPLYDTTTLCAVTTQIVPQFNGYDIIYTINNPTSTHKPVPALYVPGHIMELQIHFLDSRFGCVWQVMDTSAGNGLFSPDLDYPRYIYSPVLAARDSNFVVGLALQYDVMHYKHHVRMSWGRTVRGSQWGDAWNMRYFLDDRIIPGDTRTYTVTVRYQEPADWIYTFEPYRTYFISKYGYVRYLQDLRPCFGVSTSDPLWISETNERGFAPLRPDLNGWGPTVDRDLNTCLTMGWRRIMQWAPSGCYKTVIENNFPPQFMTEWLPPMVDTADQLLRYRENGIELFQWWGRASQYADRWDDDVLEDFDPDNPVMADAMMREWDLVQETGADGAGLEFLIYMDVWKALPWVEELQRRHPNLYLVAEPACTDIMTTILPIFVQSSRNPNPHLLADYLVPGREIWLYMKGAESTMERALEVIGWGMTVCSKDRTLDAAPLYKAAEAARGRIVR